MIKMKTGEATLTEQGTNRFAGLQMFRNGIGRRCGDIPPGGAEYQACSALHSLSTTMLKISDSVIIPTTR